MGEQVRRRFRTKEIIKFAGALVLVLGLSACGYDGWVRYPCQNYENWYKPECQKPECEVSGTCAEDILGDDIYEKNAPNK